MTPPLRIRLPDEIHARLHALKDGLTQRAGGVEQDFSKVVRHVLIKGLEVVEAETSTPPLTPNPRTPHKPTNRSGNPGLRASTEEVSDGE